MTLSHTNAYLYCPMQAVKDAHRVLSDVVLRNKYDEWGYASLGPQYAKYAVSGKSVLPM